MVKAPIDFRLDNLSASIPFLFMKPIFLPNLASSHYGITAIQGMGALTSICWGWIGGTQFMCCRNTWDDISHTISRSVGQRSYPWVVWIFSCVCTMARGLFHRFASYVKLIQPMSEWYVSYHFQVNRSKVKITRFIRFSAVSAPWLAVYACGRRPAQ